MGVSLSHTYNYRRVPHTIPGKGIYTIDFEGHNPNFYRLNNMSNLPLYCSTNAMPRENFYDFMSKPKSVANFSEPFVRDKLYILNPNDEECAIILTSWSGEFNPTYMAVSELTMNPDAVVKTDGVINAVNCDVPVEGLTAEDVQEIKKALGDGDGNSDKGIEAHTRRIRSYTEVISDSLHNMSTYQGTESIRKILSDIRDKEINVSGGSNGISNTYDINNSFMSIKAPSGYYIASVKGNVDVVIDSNDDLPNTFYLKNSYVYNFDANIWREILIKLDTDDINITDTIEVQFEKNFISPNTLESLLLNNNMKIEEIITKLTYIQNAVKPGFNVSSYKQIENWSSSSTTSLSASTSQYIGEFITNLSDDKIQIEWAVLGNGTRIDGIFTIEEWNKICHIVKVTSMQLKTSDISLKPVYTIYTR